MDHIFRYYIHDYRSYKDLKMVRFVVHPIVWFFVANVNTEDFTTKLPITNTYSRYIIVVIQHKDW